jgi:hypothetical protein
VLRRMEELPSGVLGVQAVGRETREDYTSFVAPLVDEQQRRGRRVRFLYYLGSEFPSATAAAVVNDLRLGRRCVHAFEKCAVVSDASWVRGAPELVGSLMPCPILTVANGDIELAVRWLTAPLAASNLELELTTDRVLILRPQGAVSREDFRAMAGLLDPWIAGGGALRGVVINLERSGEPEDAAALLDHMRFMRSQHGRVRRVAAVLDKDPDITARLARIFTSAEVRSFSSSHERAAIAWCERP